MTVQPILRKAIILNHLQSFQNNDLKAVMSDYTDGSILITQGKTYTGLKEIEGFFLGLIAHFPQGRSNFDLEQLFISNEVAYIDWKAKTPSLHVPIGTDTFFVKEAKIDQQIFAGQLIYL